MRRSLRPLLLALPAIGVALWAQSLAGKPELLDAAILFATAVALLLLATRGQPDLLAAPPKASQPAGGDQEQPARLGLDLLLAGIAANALALALFRLGTRDQYAWIVYFGSLLLALPGLRLLFSRQSHAERRDTPTHREWELLAIVLIVLVGAFMRLHQLDEQPAGLFYDEAMYGLDAQRVARGEAYPVYFEANFGRGALYIYLLAGFVKLFGDTAFTLRLASAAIGILTIPALYVFVRQLAGRHAALIAALLLAVSRWHVNFSRVAFDAIALPLLELALCYFLIKGLRRGRGADFLWAGVAAGLGLNSYVAFRLVPLAAGCYVVMALFGARRRPDPSDALNRRPGDDIGASGELSPGTLSGSERKSMLLGLGALVLSALLVASPFIQLTLLHPKVVNQRLMTASVFAGKDVAGGAQAILDNAGKHLLMFNVRGDPNGRHNLPGEPMLDFITAALFVVGVGYSVSRARRKEHAFLLLWFLAMLSAGILSVDFEAPQALRSIGALPLAIIFAALPLAWLVRLATRHGRPLASGMGIAVLALLAVAGDLNYDNYFVRQATSFASWNDFSTGEAFTAREMRRLGPDWQAYVSSLWYQSPTMRFLAPQTTAQQRISPTDSLPLRESGDRNAAIFLDIQQSSLYAAAKRYYPNATFKEFTPPFGGPPAMLEVLLRSEDVRGAQGLDATYYSTTDWTGPPAMQRRDGAISFDWSAGELPPAPFSVEWNGVLRVDEYAGQTLGIQSPDAMEVWLDGNLVLNANGAQSPEAEQRVRLAKGNHTLRVRAVVPSAAGKTELYWRLPNGPINVSAAELYLAPVSSNGLLGSYFPNLSWNGEPALQQIDPTLALYFHITPLPRPYTVEWRGKIQAPVSGVYDFGLESIDDSWLEIDGAPVVETHVPNKYEERRVSLAAGWHQVVVRYVDKSGWSHVNLYWTLPSGLREIVPADRLRPPEGGDAVLLTTSTRPPAMPIGQANVPARGVAPPVSVLGDGLKGPRDVLVAKDGSVLVADTGNARVVRFSSDGRLLNQIGRRGGNPGELQNPIGLATAPDGDIVVLDEETGFVNHFGLDGQFKQRFAGPGNFFHPRAVAVGPDGAIYVADTGFARIVAFNPDGVKRAELGGKGDDPGKLLGPTSLAVDAEGMLWVVDAENGRVQRLSPQGRFLGSFAVPPGESVDGAHLALAADRVYVSDPLAHVVRAYSHQGQVLAEWGRPGEQKGEFRRPVGIAVDPAGNVWVAERDNDRVQELRP